MIALLSAAALAGGWTQPEGGYYLKAGYLGIAGVPTTEGFDINGERVDIGDFSRRSLLLYGEYGLTDEWTALLVSSPIGFTTYEDNRALYSGYTRFGVRRALTTGALRTAAEVQVGGNPPIGAVDLADEDDVVWQAAVATASASGTLQLGSGFGKGAWVSTEAGYRWKSHLSDQIIGGIQVGRQWEHLMLDLHIPVSWSLAISEPTNFTAAGDVQYIGIGAGVGWWFTEHVGIGTALESVIIARGNLLSFPVVFDLQLR